MFTVIVSLLLSSSFFDVKLAWLLQGSWNDSLFYCAQFKCNASSADLNLHYSFTKHKCFDNLCTSFLLVQAYNPRDIHSDSLFLCQYMYRINIAPGRVHIHSQLQQINSNGDTEMTKKYNDLMKMLMQVKELRLDQRHSELLLNFLTVTRTLIEKFKKNLSKKPKKCLIFMEKPFSITKRKHFTVLIRVKLNWRHHQSSTHSLARVGRGKCSLPPL